METKFSDLRMNKLLALDFDDKRRDKRTPPGAKAYLYAPFYNGVKITGTTKVKQTKGNRARNKQINK